ncbi:hypothetical protein BDY21DRAFT_383481 [Lineolata rhizophorae]|uniref:Uncharacterized protein n=1 Tax=Lineolata rhizophorae TaxID=578093 RepID=A0A6A6PBV5_9PEZI|nr:hypothetical protein BDY21DRAFT_383481 [Lineolata rhizophorae]
MAPAHLRHQSSLEEIIDFSAEPLLEADQYIKAKRKFYDIINRFEAADDSSRKYNRPVSKNQVLRAFFRSIAHATDEDRDIDFADKTLEEKVHSDLIEFAEYLLDTFFLPLKASANKNPQPSPVYHTVVKNGQGGARKYTGTEARVSTLRRSCLIRDRYRCVVSRNFDIVEGVERYKSNGNNAQDDDGNLLRDETSAFGPLEVACILPHTLMQTKADYTQQATLAILSLFDNGVVHLIKGAEINRPLNAITLTIAFHRLLGNFELFFTPIPGHQPHTYRIDSFAYIGDSLPITRTFYLTESRSIEPPLPRLLALHRAIGHILHLSGAGEYIDEILRDMEECVRTDSSTELSRLKLHRIAL